MPMKSNSCAYLDIETTGLEPASAEITVLGIYIEDESAEKVIQLIPGEITHPAILEIFKDIKMLYTYNGAQFDLPFIKAKTGIELEKCCRHKDLMYLCWDRGLYGGLKAVEKKLGIKRTLEGIDGKGAVMLWHRYIDSGDENALKTLLEYNREDLLNLKLLRKRLETSDHIEINSSEEF